MSFVKSDRATLHRLGAEAAFTHLGLSRRAVAGLIRAGVLNARALAEAPWTDQEAGAKFSSLNWRLSVDPEGGAKVAKEIERARAELRAPTEPASEATSAVTPQPSQALPVAKEPDLSESRHAQSVDEPLAERR